MEIELRIDLTQKGLPAMWEEGSGYTNTGHSIIVAGPNGEKLKPVYIRRRGGLVGVQHALFVIQPGFIVVKAYHHRLDFEIKVMRIKKIDMESKIAICEVIHTFDKGEWDIDPPENLIPVIKAAKEKATCYHCRYPVYFIE